jgi:XTP/dITP diphosphohydrolase
MKIYLASSNEHKRKEMQEIFPEHTIVLPKDENISFNPEENGSSFIENSLLKAKALWDIIHKPVLADDSGICVEALNGFPGIYSARYCGNGKNVTSESDKLTSSQRNELLIAELNETQSSNRNCAFVCSLVYYYGNNRFYAVQESLEGTVVNSINEVKGNGGFGYDPIVFLKQYNKTVAELSESEKNAISHRGKACKKMSAFLKNKTSV